MIINNKNKLFFLCICMMAAVLMTGCAGKASSDTASVKQQEASGGNNYALDNGYTSDMSTASVKDAGTSLLDENQVAAAEGRKLIKEVNLDVETKAFDDFLAGLEDEAGQLGGYIEYSSVGGNSYIGTDSSRNAWFTIRVPEEQLEVFISQMGENGNIVNIARNVRDITLEYVDVEGRISTLETSLNRLTELLEQAGSMEDILAIESKISDVRYELESYQSQMNAYDNLITYSTVTMNVSEVLFMTASQGQSVWERIQSGFLNSIYNLGQGIGAFIIGFIIAIPYIIAGLLLAGGLLWLVRVFHKRRRKKNEEVKGSSKTEDAVLMDSEEEK